jgi:hypothetical protein
MQKVKLILKKGSLFQRRIKRDVWGCQGNVAWWASGKLYKHKEGVDFILDGSSGNDITEYLISPKSFGSKSEWNYVYSANNQPEAVDGFYILVIIFRKTEPKKLLNY